MFSTRHIAAAVPALLAPAAAAQVIDFQHLEQRNDMVNFVGSVVIEDGFEITKDAGEQYDFGVFGTLERRYPGSTALFNDTIGGLHIIRAKDGRSFDVLSIDFAMLNGAGTVVVDVVGEKTGGGQVFQQIVHSDDGPPLELMTYELDGFVGLDSIHWTEDFPYHQFDNVVISIGGYGLNVTGRCPGMITVSWSGAMPDVAQGLVFGRDEGATTIPGGPCAGTRLGLQGGVMLVRTLGSGDGSGEASSNAGTSACGGFLQLVQVGSCRASNVDRLPEF